MTRRLGRLRQRGFRALAGGMFTHQPRDPGWHSTGAPKIHSLSSVRHRMHGGKYQIIRGRNLQTIQRAHMQRIHAAKPIVTELPILEQNVTGTEMKVAVPSAAGINFSKGKILFLTDGQPWSYKFGPGDIGASKLISSRPNVSKKRHTRRKRIKRRRR